MRFIFIIFLSALVFSSCRKEEKYVYPVPQYEFFENGSLTHFGVYRLFTKQGEITDPSLVQQYAQEFSQFFYTASGGFNDPVFKRFSVVNPDSMINPNTVPVGELHRTLTDTYDRFTGHGRTIVNDTNSVNLHLMKYRIYKTVTTQLGYTYLDVEIPSYIMKRVQDTLFFPFTRYINITRGNYFSFSADKFNNVFEPAGTSKLGAQDTLLVQTFDLALKKTN